MAIDYVPISSKSDLEPALKQIDSNFRQIAAENQTKTVAQNGGTALEMGKLSNGTYGILLYDPANTARILIGFHANGQPVIAVSKANRDVIKALGD